MHGYLASLRTRRYRLNLLRPRVPNDAAHFLMFAIIRNLLSVTGQCIPLSENGRGTNP